MNALKKLPAGSTESALGKAERYRLLGEPCEAESICADVLAADPGNHRARVLMILSLTDQLRSDLARVNDAKALIEALPDAYERLYYSEVLAERRGKAQFAQGMPAAESNAEAALREAMQYYEQAEALCPPDTPDPVLRWNTCARTLDRRGRMRESETPAEAQAPVQLLE